MENIYPSGFTGTPCAPIKKKKNLTITLKLKSGREKAFTTSTADIFLGRYIEKSKNVSKAIHPPSWDISLEKYLQTLSLLTPHFFCHILALAQTLFGLPQLFLQVADFSGPLLRLTLKEAVFLLRFLKHTFNWL